MKKKRHSVDAIMRILRQADSGQKIADVCKEHHITEQTFHRWRRKYADMDLARAGNRGDRGYVKVWRRQSIPR